MVRFCLLVVLLLAAPGPAPCTEPTPDSRPIWPLEVGAVWSFVGRADPGGPLEGSIGRRLVGRGRFKLPALDTEAFEVLDETGASRTYSYWSPGDAQVKGLLRYANRYLGGEPGADDQTPPRPVLPMPYEAPWQWEETWGVQTDMHTPMPPPEDLVVRFSGRATPDQEVSVPAGHYRALHVTLEGLGVLHGRVVYEYWFVPGLGPVKFTEQGRVFELVEYRAPRTGQRSLKGWELYLRTDGGQVCFGLLRGTNRLKTGAEIETALRIQGLEALREALECLSVGEQVSLQTTPPDFDLSRQLMKLADELDLRLHVDLGGW